MFVKAQEAATEQELKELPLFVTENMTVKAVKLVNTKEYVVYGKTRGPVR